MPPVSEMPPLVRFGVVGVGQRGGTYARALAEGEVPGATLTALCDVRPETLAPFSNAARFDDVRALLRDARLDAVVVATPHPAHEEPTRLALAAGLHVLAEKPLAVRAADVLRILEAYERRPRRAQVFATALVLRADPRFVKLRNMLSEGALGRVERISWTVTDCLRSDAYYASADWRGTFAGEGGGVLVNQCLHQLDLWQWLFGMPDRVRAFFGFGRFHAIEVEDQVTAYLEYASGTTGVFVASTGEAPGTNRLEVAAERGRVVIEGASVEVWRNAVPTPERIRTDGVRSPAPRVEYERSVLPVGGVGVPGLLTNFVRAVSGVEALIAPAHEGLRSIELSTALYASGLGGKTVELSVERAPHPRIARAVGPS